MLKTNNNTIYIAIGMLFVTLTILGTISIGSGSSSDNYMIIENGVSNDSDVIELNTTTLGTCNSSTEGHIRYNGTSHYGCNGSLWNVLY